MTKTVLVTGGNSGIGYAIAGSFKNKGYKVYISGRNEEKVQKAASELGVECITFDLSDLSQIENLDTTFFNEGLDVLVNNAGIAHPLPVEMYSLDNFDDHINTNLRAPIFLIKHLLSALEKNKGCIINLSSIITRKGAPGFGIYAATKGAIEAFTRNLAIELAPKNIRINAICPGAIDTPMFYKFGLTKEESDHAKEQVVSTIPMNRLGKSNEIAEVVISQAESTYVTGATWHVDGGVDT